MTALSDLSDLSMDQLRARVQAATARIEADRYDWLSRARPEQLPPPGATTWFLLAGAGFGKTRTAAETLRLRAQERPLHIAVVHEGKDDVRDVCFEHRRSGLLAVTPPEWVASYNRGGPVLTLVNGSVFRGFTANDPDALRGYDFDGFWFEEFAAWGRKSRASKPLDCWDTIQFRLREATDPFGIISTTPKNVRHVKTLVAEARDEASGIVITRGRTMDNAANLSPRVMESLRRRYEGTRLGRQELGGELLEEVEGALWRPDMIEAARWPAAEPLPELIERVTMVDPSGSETGDATGIVTLGRARPTDLQSRDDGLIVVLADNTLKGTPEQRWEAVVTAAHTHQVGVIGYERLYGGDNNAMAIRAAHKQLVRTGDIPGDWMLPRLVPVPASGSKYDRAQPVAQLYEQQTPTPERPAPDLRIVHAHSFPELEDEQTTWEATSRWSPNRMDALVHGARYLTKTAGYQATAASPVGMTRPGAGIGRRR